MIKERREIDREELTDSFWTVYEKTDDYRNGKIYSINSAHPLIRSAEEKGLKRVYDKFIEELSAKGKLKDALKNRNKLDWLNEWKQMHSLLFRDIYKDCGRFRREGEDYYFGSFEDKDRYGIPDGKDVAWRIVEIADIVGEDLKYIDSSNMEYVCDYLAKVHYGFVIVHPFKDGNGRIARAIVDQLAMSLSYVPVLAGFPRTNKDVKKEYHNAINNCIEDQSRAALSNWIYKQMKPKVENIA